MAIDPVDNVSKKLPAFPYDQNQKGSALLIFPIVSGGEVVGYLPAAATDNGDGTASLKVDTEITIGGDLIFEGIDVKKWGGTAQTGADLTPLFQNLDVDLSTRASEDTLVAVRDSLDTVEAKLQSIIDNTDSLEVNTDDLEAKVQSVRDQLDVLLSTRATEATLLLVKGDLDAISAEFDVALSTRASEATLATVKTNLDDVKTKLDTLIAKDYATETTLAGLKVDFEDVDFATETTLSGIKTDTANLDVALSTRASEATLADAKTDLDTLAAVDYATEATLGGIKTQTDKFTFDMAGKLETTATIDTGDIQIGAVEIKNATDDTRVVVKTDGVDNALVVTQNSQPLPTGAATEATLADVKTDLDTLTAVDYATETTLAGLKSDFEAVDFATETTLSGISTKLTDKSQETRITDGVEEVAVNASSELQVRDDDANTTLTTIAGLDFATQTTLATLLTQSDFDTKIALVATEATVSTLLTESDFDTKIALVATEVTLSDILSTQTDKSQETRITDGVEEAAVNASNELQVRDDDANTTLTTISGKDFATETTLGAAKTDLDTLASTVMGGRVQVDADLSGADIEIGAVEIKNATDDTRVVVKTDGTDNALVVTQNSQPLPAGAATDSTVATLLTEADFDSKVATLATDATLETLLTESDFDTKIALVATEVTLAGLKTDFDAVDFATEATLDDVKTNLDDVKTKLDTANSTLSDILDKTDVYVIGEVPTGDIDGINDTFTTFNTFKPGTTHVYINGIRLREGVGFDYVEEVDHVTLTFSTIPQIGDTLLVDYTKL